MSGRRDSTSQNVPESKKSPAVKSPSQMPGSPLPEGTPNPKKYDRTGKRATSTELMMSPQSVGKERMDLPSYDIGSIGSSAGIVKFLTTPDSTSLRHSRVYRYTVHVKHVAHTSDDSASEDFKKAIGVAAFKHFFDLQGGATGDQPQVVKVDSATYVSLASQPVDLTSKLFKCTVDKDQSKHQLGELRREAYAIPLFEEMTGFGTTPDAIKQATVSAISELDGRNIRGFLIRYECHEISLFPTAEQLLHNETETVNQSKSDNQTRDSFNSYIAMQLAAKVQSKGAAPTIHHGNKVFVAPYKVDSGVESRLGLEGQILLRDHQQPVLSWKPCDAQFYPESLVSDFLVAYVGPQVCFPRFLPMETRIQKASDQLNGARVIIPLLASDKGKVRTICGLGDSAQSDPRALHGLSVPMQLEGLKYQNMPCVNVGTKDRPFLFPAELCKFAPNQPFTGSLPISADSSLFKVPSQGEREAKQQKSRDRSEILRNREPTDVFPTINSGNPIKVTFASISLPGANLFKNGAWGSFKREIGERYGDKLLDAVNATKQSIFADLVYAGDREILLNQLREYLKDVSGKHSIVVLAVPKSLDRIVADDVKRLCDTEIGIHCVLVSAKEINKRYNARASDEMVKYTGGIVCKIFAHFSKPKVDDQEILIGSLKDMAIARTGVGCLVGAHFVKIAGDVSASTDGGLLERHIVKSNAAFNLVTVVSFYMSSLMETHRVYNTAVSPYENLRESIKHHLEVWYQKSQSALTYIAIHQNGVSPKDLPPLKDELKSLDTSMPSCRISLVTAAHETGFGLSEPTEPVGITKAQAALPFAKSEVSEHGVKELCNTFGLEALLRDTYRREVGQASQKASLVTYQQALPSATAPGTFKVEYTPSSLPHDRVRTDYTRLENRKTPDILYLAEKASERARTRLRRVPETDVKGVPTGAVRFEVQPVCKELENTLYFL